jgi:ATP-dependent DNA ligase
VTTPAASADLAAAISKLSARSFVLDGEAAIYDQQLRSRFDWPREPDPDAVATPPLLMAFDLLYHDQRRISARTLRRAFALDVLACPRGGGRLRLIATVEDPEAIRAILAALVASREVAGRAPPGAPAQTPSPAAALGA